MAVLVMPLSIFYSQEFCQNTFGKTMRLVQCLVVVMLSVVVSLDLSSVQIWQQLLPQLWRNPDQERMGHDCCSLCGQVGVSGC